MDRLGIRLKMTLAFSAAIAVLLTGLGLFIYFTLQSDLDKTVDQGLRSRAADISALVREADAGLRSGRGADQSFAQVLDLQGRVIDSSPGLSRSALLDGAALARAGVGATLLDSSRPPLGGEARLLGVPATGADQRPVIVVVGTSLESRDEALRALAGLLVLGFPIALVLASLAGYATAAGALRPIESIRRRASEISAGRPGRRLPLPTAHDEVHRLGETLNVMLERLESAFERERQFVADASHELRTPLAILKSELELAHQEGQSVEQLQLAIGSAAEETDRLTQLAEDLLVIARSQEGRLPVRSARIPAVEILDGVRARFTQRADDAGRRIHVDAELSTVLTGDQLRLEQAIGNLVDNALRYSDGDVHLQARDDGAATVLRVTDEGPGFPPDFLEHAFDRFSRIDHARGRGGAGLGLSIVAAIAAAHGGHAQAANQPGDPLRGEVWMTLPDAPPAGG